MTSIIALRVERIRGCVEEFVARTQGRAPMIRVYVVGQVVRLILEIRLVIEKDVIAPLLRTLLQPHIPRRLCLLLRSQQQLPLP